MDHPRCPAFPVLLSLRKEGGFGFVAAGQAPDGAEPTQLISEEKDWRLDGGLAMAGALTRGVSSLPSSGERSEGVPSAPS